MRKYLTEYVKKMENLVLNNHKFSKEEKEMFLIKIGFFQHERLIHLIVTLMFSLFALIFMVLGMVSFVFLIIFFILLGFVLCYILHYYFLEKSVQYLYKLYDKANQKLVDDEMHFKN